MIILSAIRFISSASKITILFIDRLMVTFNQFTEIVNNF